MKKVLILLLVMVMITTSVYALNIFSWLFYDKVFLKCIHRYVLVHRFAGTVDYILSADGRWVPIARPLAVQYEKMYKAQLRKNSE